MKNAPVDLVFSTGSQETHKVGALTSTGGTEYTPEEVTTRTWWWYVAETRVASHLGGHYLQLVGVFNDAHLLTTQKFFDSFDQKWNERHRVIAERVTFLPYYLRNH